jgi:septum formation protein
VNPPRRLVLASTSRYRRELLDRLALEFAVEAPGVDEVELESESPAERALRLAIAKAQAVAERDPQAVVIGSDQVASVAEAIFDKPGDAARARAQLARLSGKTVLFQTAVAVVCLDTAVRATHLDRTQVVFRALSAAEIERYVAREQPVDSAASFKSERLGISLLERIDTADPSALVGLPLIWVAARLRQLGYAVP